MVQTKKKRIRTEKRRREKKKRKAAQMGGTTKPKVREKNQKRMQNGRPRGTSRTVGGGLKKIKYPRDHLPGQEKRIALKNQEKKKKNDLIEEHKEMEKITN